MKAVVSIGSNLGDRAAAVRFAVDRLRAFLEDLTISPVVETEPEGPGLQEQPPYLNAVVTGETALGAREVLDRLLAVEREFGRSRPAPKAPRTLDLDLILLGDTILDEPGLTVPHPRFRERFFVLGPLVEIAPDLRDPVSGLRIGELLRALLRDATR
jgi:2-amino-4-hydroxy-6-hydroxymethyldihydropteridine diphosphokinase